MGFVGRGRRYEKSVNPRGAQYRRLQNCPRFFGWYAAPTNHRIKQFWNWPGGPIRPPRPFLASVGRSPTFRVKLSIRLCKPLGGKSGVLSERREPAPTSFV